MSYWSLDEYDIPIDAIVIPEPAPVSVDPDPSGSVVSGAGSSANAESLDYAPSGIVSMAWAQSPHRVLWVVRSDGLLLGMTYRRDQGVLAWHRHPMTNGAVEDVAVIPDPATGQAQVWLAVQREIGGVTKRYIERMRALHEPTSSTDTDSYCFVDSSLTYSGSPVTTIGNLSHLEGETVSVWADGVRHADKTVSGGQITLDRAASEAHVGLHTPSYIVTLPAEAGSGNGTAQGKMKNVGRVRVRFLDLIGGKAGRRLDALDDVHIRRAADAQDATPALQSGIFEAVVETHFDREGQFVIVQDYPAPMTITALIPEVDTADY